MGLRLLALACLVGAAFAGPFQRETVNRCATKCPTPSSPKFNYEPGKKYVFEYRGENSISVAGEKKPGASIEGIVEFHVITKCELILKLKNVRIEQKLTTQEIEELVQKLQIPVHYSYNDGKIEHICPSPEESKQSLNIKKGILSSMVNSMTKLDKPQEVKEYDSLGYCTTKYTVSYAHGMVIRKEKSLKSCTNRHSLITSLITSPYESPDSQVHTLPVFPQEKLVCTQKIENQVIRRVHCDEYARIQPLKNRDSIIEFEGKIELNFLSKDPVDSLRSHEPKSQESLLYNLEEPQESESLEREAEEILRRMCSKTSGVIGVAISKDFIQLVTVVKTLSYSSLDRIYRSLTDGHLCSSKKVRDVFVDTLPMAGSDAAVKLMVQLLERKEITGLKARLWPASLALISNPTKKTVEAVIPLLKMEHSAPILLGVSALVHRFCSRENCDSVSAVQQIVTTLNHRLGRRCSSDKEEEVFASLKAYGNIGYCGDAEKNILSCAQDNSKSTRLRLAAIDAFRRSTHKRPQDLLDLYANQNEDIEVRIAAFASVMKQVDEEQLRQIKRIAERESNEQVSGYASTLINNMKKTSSQLKKSVRELLNDIEINTPKVNYWENSKNIEMSTYSEYLNIGAGVEADIIHSSESKIPRSIYSRLDLDVFDKNINFFEVGMRAEGLEDLVRKLIGLKDKIPKVPSWNNLLSAKNLIGETDADVSLFIRTMNTEIFDVSASDLTAVGEMVEIAEVMNKLAHEKNADFSHSFLFLNSKLVIPSVTGRSYSIDLTGSATVGLTASSKLNVLSFPRNADAHLHFQPSVNVEISTTVGIMSNKQRPDMKLVSRMHLESDMEAKFHIKDGHVALASLSIPSENVVMAKISTDVIEIDAHHHEKRVFDKMQKKVDYCFDKLSKPLGIAVCGNLEVPKPFVTRTFPYIQSVGSFEFAIKKTDTSFKSYELSFEIPKQSGPSMKYLACLDTPGSQTSRRFAAELDVKQRISGHKSFSLELTSPFKSAGGSGSYAWREDLVLGSFELHSSSSRLLTANLSTEITSSRSRKIYKPSLEVAYRNNGPMRVDGTISVIKGRKQQLSIDLRSNKPSTRPLTLKGTIMTEGQFELSKTADWKLSSDLAIQSHFADAQIRSALEKRSKQSKTISSSFSLDYQRRGLEKHSIRLTGSSQKSSGKRSTNAQFETTQFPAASWALNWDMQGETRHSLKNDISIKYGLNPESQYVNIRHRSHMPEVGRGECKVSVKAPQLNIESELTVTHELEHGDSPKVHLGADMSYKPGKHIRSIFEVNCESKYPLKANSRVELEFSGVKYTYWDEIEEKSRNSFEGKSNFQWKSNKHVELKYKYQQLSDDFKLHHELETSLKVPSHPVPMKSKVSLKVIEKALSFEAQLNLQRNSEYSLQSHLSQEGVTYVSLKTPQAEGNLKVHNEHQKKALDWNLKLKTRHPRHIIASAVAEYGDKKKFEVEMLLDADRRPDEKLFLSTSVEIKRRNSGDTYTSNSKMQIKDIVSISLSESGETSLRGSHEASLEASIKNCEPISISYRQEVYKGKAKSVMKFSKNHVEKAEIEMEGTLNSKRNLQEAFARASIKSLDNSFKNMDISVNHQMSHSGSSKMLKSSMKYQKGSSIYKAEWNSDLQPNAMEMKAQLETPHTNFEKQALGIVYQQSEKGISTIFSVQTSDNKVIAITSDMKVKNNELSTTWTVKSPFEIARDVKVHLSLDNHYSRKSLLSYIDVNGARMTDVQASMESSLNEVDVQGRVKVAPVPNVQLQGMSFAYQRTNSSVSLSVKAELQNSKEISVTSEIKEERDTISATATLNTPYKSIKDAKVHLSVENNQSKRNFLFYIDSNEERKADAEISVSTPAKNMEVHGRWKTIRTPEISAHLKVDRNGKSLSVSANVLKGTAPLLKTSIKKQIHREGESYSLKTESFENTLLDLQLSREISGDSLKKISLKASGPFSPLSLSVSASRNEKSSLNMEITACRDSRTCYSLKTYHKGLVSSGSYHHYRKITFDLEKSSAESAAETLGGVQFLLTSAENDYRSKVLVRYQEKSVGYDIMVHKREREHDPCSFDLQFFMPECTSRARGTLEQNSERVMLEIEAIPNSAVPSRKLSFEAQKESHPQSNEISGYVKISTPSMIKPFQLSGHIQKQGKYPVSAKFEMYCSPKWEKLTLEAKTTSEHGKKSLKYKLYLEDKSLEVHVHLMKKNSREEDMYGYEWSYTSSRSTQKKGGLSIKFSQKKSGRPQNVDIKYFTPSVDLQIQGRSEHAPSDLSFHVMSRGQVFQEIHFKTRDSCIEMEVLRSGPFFKSSVCVNKHDGNSVQLVSINAHYRRHKCLDIRVGLEPENPSFVDVVMQWKKQDICRGLSELTGLSELLHDRSLKELEKELKEQLRQFKHDFIMPFLNKWQRKLQEIKEEFTRKLKELFKSNSRILRQQMQNMESYKNSVIEYLRTLIPWNYIKTEIVRPLKQALRCLSVELYQIILQHVPQFGKIVWEVTKTQFEHCLKKFCFEGTFCHEFLQTYQRHGLEKSRMLVQKKISQTKRSLEQKLKRMQVPDVRKVIREAVAFVRKEIDAIFGQFLGNTIIHQIRDYAKLLEEKLRVKAIDFLDQFIDYVNHFLGQAEKDEDFRTAKSLVLGAQKKLVKAWKNKEQLAKDTWKPMRESLVSDAKNALKSKIEVKDFNLEEGHINLRVRNPFGPSQTKVFSNEIRAIKRKIQDSVSFY